MRRPSLAAALAGVFYGDVSTDDAHAARLAGLEGRRPLPATAPPRSVQSEAAAGGLLDWTGQIPRKVGAFWSPQPWGADVAWRRAQRHAKGPKHALRWGAGVRGNDTVGALVVVPVEIDGSRLEAQAEILDAIEAAGGPRVALCVMSGDTRADSLQRLGLAGDQVQAGKSLHAYYAIRAVEPKGPDLETWARCVRAAIVLTRGDVRCTDPARLLRSPAVVAGERGRVRDGRAASAGLVRVQTALRADPAAVYDLDELAELLEGVADEWGIDLAAGWSALTLAERLWGAADKAEGEGLREQAAELRTMADHAVQTLEVPDADAMRAGEALAGLAKRAGRAGTVLAAAGHYGRATLPRALEVRAADGRRLPFHLWGGELAEGDTVRCWAPTPEGERHTAGAAAGKQREAPAATLLRCEQTGAAIIACHVSHTVYHPERPRDPALAGAMVPTDAPRYLDADQVRAALEAAPAVLLRCDTGSGKTTALAPLTRPERLEDARVIVSSRVAIVREAAARYGAACYLEHDGALRLGELRDVAVCVNSVGRITPADGLRLTLVLEESEQVAAALLGGTMKGPEAREALDDLAALAMRAVHSGGRIVLADAFAGEQSRALLEAIAPGVRCEVVEHRRRRSERWRFWTQGESDKSARAGAIEALRGEVRRGRRVYVACTSKAAAETLARTLRADGARVLVYTGDSDNDTRRELRNVEAAWAKARAQVVICSPVVSAGVSYDPADPAERFGLAVMLADRTPAADWATCVQMLDRVRHVEDVWIWTPERDAGEPVQVPSLELLRSRILERHRDTARAAAAAEGFDAAISELPTLAADRLFRVQAACEHAHAVRAADIAGDLRAFAALRGAPVVESEAGRGDATRKALRLAREQINAEWAAEVVEAETLTQRDYEALKRDGHADQGERAALVKTTLLDRYGDGCDLEALAIADESGKVWGETHELVRAGLVADGETRRAAARDAESAESGTRARAHADAARSVAGLLLLRLAFGDRWLSELLAPMRGRGQRDESPGAALLRRPLEVWGEWTDELEAVSWSAESLDGFDLAERLRAELREHGVSRTAARDAGCEPAAVESDPVRAVGRVLRSMGLATASERLRQGGERVRVYRLDLDAWRATCQRAERLNLRARGCEVSPVFAGQRHEIAEDSRSTWGSDVLYIDRGCGPPSESRPALAAGLEAAF